LHAVGLDADDSCFIPQAVFYSLMLLKIGITIARNISS
jgi:hypothetical protein